ncbi:MAG: cysteine hydrolase [Chloroflexi bacterium]|nr:cysteine hydrolase [Chloroflexota bacterium]
MSDAVLVIDMTRGFLEKGYNLYVGDASRAIIPNVARLLERELARGSQILYLCDNHVPDDLEFKMFAPHCIVGTIETQVIPELARFPGEYIPKRRYSAFYDSALDDRLKALKPDKLIICGVCTDICVCHTVADARNRDYPVEVPVSCVSTFNEQAHRFAMEHMEKVLGAKLITA